MEKAIEVAAWFIFITSGVINLVFLLTPNIGRYPMWALAPVLIGVALLTVYISRRKPIRK